MSPTQLIWKKARTMRELAIEAVAARKAAEAELAEARSLLETIANSTEHADAAQKWETEKAELVQGWRGSYSKLAQIADWLGRNAEILETAAKRHERWQSLADEELADARNYRATAADIRKHMASADSTIAKYEAK
jgi:hypothetical protein